GFRTIDPIVVLNVKDEGGHTLWQVKPKKARIVPEAPTYLIDNVLNDDSARQIGFGLNSPLKLPGREAPSQSGTSDDARDTRTIGYTPDLVAGVWVGNSNNKPMPGATSTFVAAPIWHDFMIAALDGKPAQTFRVPSGVTFADICVGTSDAARAGCQSTREVF